MSLLDKDTMDEMYSNILEMQKQSMNVECLIEWQTNENMMEDDINQTISGSPTPHNKTVYCSANEYRSLGEVESTNIIAAGLPLGRYKIFLDYNDKVILNSNYIKNTLKFTLRPNSEQPIVLKVNYSLSRIQYFIEDQDYPTSQMHIGNIIIEE